MDREEIKLGTNCHIKQEILNKYGFIAGIDSNATTNTAKKIIEECIACKIPVLVADVKDRFSGMASEYNAEFWDVYGKNGLHVKEPLLNVKPYFLSQLLNLSDEEKKNLYAVYSFALDEHRSIHKIPDLINYIKYVIKNIWYYRKYKYLPTKVDKKILKSIIKQLEILSANELSAFFGPNRLLVAHFKDNIWPKVNVLDCSRLVDLDYAYFTVLANILDNMKEDYASVDYSEKTDLVIIIDEADLLFEKKLDKEAFLQFAVLVSHLYNKGVGFFFITRNPYNIPETIRKLLKNKILHSLQSNENEEIANLEEICSLFDTKKNFDIAEEIGKLKHRQAIVSITDERGKYSTKKVIIGSPKTENSVIDADVRMNIVHNSRYYEYYKEEFANMSKIKWPSFDEKFNELIKE